VRERVCVCEREFDLLSLEVVGADELELHVKRLARLRGVRQRHLRRARI